ncbi:MAG TPA: DUF397 domain-containing protein [Streptosporangiaceae bacterium]|jgi:hypothetical protein
MTDRQTVQPRASNVAPLQETIWRKSTYSGTQGNCVEVATNLPGIVAVRDSKGPDRAVLTFEPATWRAFLRLV